MHVSSAAGIDDLAASAGSKAASGDSTEEDITQEDKPRSRIVAEYLAHGYAISDTAIQRAIALDNKHGVSSRFTNALQQFDSKYKATDRARDIDTQYGLTERAQTGFKGLHSYFEKAISTPTGRKLVDFYTVGDKQVRDIHAEARRLADLKSGKGSPTSGGSGGAAGGATGADGTMEGNEKTMEHVSGSEKTTCQCGGNTGVCPCAEGKCACSGCAKGELHGEKSATGPAAEVAQDSNVAPLGEKS